MMIRFIVISVLVDGSGPSVDCRSGKRREFRSALSPEFRASRT
jgi:hypothetical protein